MNTLPINMENMKKVFENPEVFKVVGDYLLQRAFSETMREKVNEVYKTILQEIPVYDDTSIRFKDNPRHKNVVRTRILNHKNLYLTEDNESCQKIWDMADKILKKMGIKPEWMERDFCPALCAESDLRNIEHRIIELTGSPFGVTVNSLLYGGMEKYDKWIDLAVRAIVNHPKFVKPKIENHKEFVQK